MRQPTTKQLLLDAADIVERRGLAKGVYYSLHLDMYGNSDLTRGPARFCAVGSIVAALVGEHKCSGFGQIVTDDALVGRAVRKLMAAANLKAPTGHDYEAPAYSWSDRSSAKTVIAALKKAARLCNRKPQRRGK